MEPSPWRLQLQRQLRLHMQRFVVATCDGKLTAMKMVASWAAGSSAHIWIYSRQQPIVHIVLLRLTENSCCHHNDNIRQRCFQRQNFSVVQELSYQTAASVSKDFGSCSLDKRLIQVDAADPALEADAQFCCSSQSHYDVSKGMESYCPPCSFY